MYFAGAIVAALAGIAHAQSAVDVQVVQVASTNGSLTFSPEKVTAAEGSMVQFQFMGGNHTVTQSIFDQPCVPFNVANPQATEDGVYSGYVPTAASESQGQRPVFTIMINNSAPMWLYCGQGPHCANGMSMVINENASGNSSRTLENYKLAASALGGDAPGGAPGGAGGDGGEIATPPPAPGQEGASADGDASAASSLSAPGALLVLAGAAFFLF